MKTIIMAQTIPLLCKTQEEADKLLEEGYTLKEVNKFKYLVKDEIL